MYYNVVCILQNDSEIIFIKIEVPVYNGRNGEPE